ETKLAQNNPDSTPPVRLPNPSPKVSEKEISAGNEPKTPSHAVVVTENLGPPTEIRPPRLSTSRPIKPPVAKKTGLTINNAARFDPVVITVPDRNGSAAVTSDQASNNDRGSPARAPCTISVSQEKVSL